MKRDSRVSSSDSEANITSPSQASKLDLLPNQDSGKGIRIIGTIIIFSLSVLGILWYFYELDVERTEDAQVNGNIVQVTTQISGTVISIDADDTDYIRAGVSLVRLNPIDQEIIYEKAQAALAKAVRSVRSQYLQVEQVRAELAQKKTDLVKAKADLYRRMRVASVGAVSQEEISHASEALQSAQAALDSTQHLLAQRLAQIDNTTIRSHPDVVSAAASLRESYIARRRTTIPAPVDGVVTKRSVQLGQRISAGMVLMSVVPLESLWVTANFKESQLKDVRIGQSVELTADIYGTSVLYHGKVVGLDAGTGSAFSLFPAQNATGNWIKVTQRVPVKISLDPQEVARNPLRVGLSMHVTVDTSDLSGQVIRTNIIQDYTYKTDVFTDELKNADEEVEVIIRANESSAPYVRAAK